MPASLNSGDAIKDPKGNVVFRIQQENKTFDSLDKLRLVISFLIVILTFIFIYQFSTYLRKRYNSVYLGLVSLVVLGFLWLYFINIIPFEFKKLVLYDAGLFASSLFSSLGILFFNVALYIITSYFYFINVLKGRVNSSIYSKVFSSALVVFSFFFAVIILKV